MAWDPRIQRAASQRVRPAPRSSPPFPVTSISQVVPDASRAWNVNLRGGNVAAGAEGGPKRSGFGGRLHKLGGAAFRNKQQQQRPQGQVLNTGSVKNSPSAPFTPAHKQRRQLERSEQAEVLLRSADKRPKAFEGGGGFLPPHKMKQPQHQQQPQRHVQEQHQTQSRTPSVAAPPSNPFYSQQQQSLSSQQLHRVQKQPHFQRQQPPHQKKEQNQQHHPRMALDKTISKKVQSVVNTGRRVVMMPSSTSSRSAAAKNSGAGKD